MLSPGVCASRAALKLHTPRDRSSACLFGWPLKSRRIMWRHELQKRRLQPQIRKEFLVYVQQQQQRVCAASSLLKNPSSLSLANGGRLVVTSTSASKRRGAWSGSWWFSRSAFKRLQRRWSQLLAFLTRRYVDCIRFCIARQLLVVQHYLQKLWTGSSPSSLRTCQSSSSPPSRPLGRRQRNPLLAAPSVPASSVISLVSAASSKSNPDENPSSSSSSSSSCSFSSSSSSSSSSSFPPCSAKGGSGREAGDRETRRLIWQSCLQPSSPRPPCERNAEEPRDGCPERGFFVNAQGLRIRVYRWRRKGDVASSSESNGSCSTAPHRGGTKTTTSESLPCRGVFLFIHGYGEHCRSHFLSRPRPDAVPDSLHRQQHLNTFQNKEFHKAHTKEQVQKGVSGDVNVETKKSVYDAVPPAAPSTAPSTVSTAALSEEGEGSLASSVHSTPSPSEAEGDATSDPVAVGLRSESKKGTLEEEAETSIRTEDDCGIPGGEYRSSWVEQLNIMGFDVLGIDLQGHGESEGWTGPRITAPLGAAAAVATGAWKSEALARKVAELPDGSSSGVAHLGRLGSAFHARGLVRELQDFAVDVLSFVWLVKHEYTGTGDDPPETPPLFLVGLSMGGWASLRAVQLAAELRSKASMYCDAAPQNSSSSFYSFSSSSSPSSPSFSPPGASAEGDLRSHSAFLHEALFVSEAETDFRTSVSSSGEARSSAATAGIRRALGFKSDSSRAASQAAHAAGVSDAEARRGLGLSGLVLLSPMLDLSKQKRKIKWGLIRPAAAAAAALAPSIPVAFPPRRRRHFPHLLEHYWSDPLTLKNGMLLGLAIAAFLGVDAASDTSALRRVDSRESRSLFVCHHEQDPLCGVSGALNCCAQMQGIEDRTMVLLRGKRSSHPHRKSHQNLAKVAHSGTRAEKQQDRRRQEEDMENKGRSSLAPAKGAPRFVHLEEVDLLHDVTVEPDQDKLFVLLKAWALERVHAKREIDSTAPLHSELSKRKETDSLRRS